MRPSGKIDDAERTSRDLVIVVGMVGEARIVEGLGRVLVGTSGLARALREAPAGVVSFGVCGGLDPALKGGDLLLARAVIARGRAIAADAAWLEALGAALPHAMRGDVVSGDAIVGSIAAKGELRRSTGAAGVDMESHQVAKAAEAAGLPFAVLRAVSDPADRALPGAALAGFKTGPGADGEPDVGAVFRALARRPWELPALIQTALDAAKAMRSLRLARGALTAPPT
jgi:hopanoid-associated phosphorylase